MKYYEDENITLYHGDQKDVLSGLEQEVNLLLTDPPFGINYQNNYTHKILDKLAGDSDSFSYKEMGLQAFRLLKENSAILVYTGWSEYPKHFVELQSCGFSMKEPLIVQKRASGKTDIYGTFQTNSDWVMFGHKDKFTFKKSALLKNKRAGTIPNKGRKPVPEFKTRFPSCWFGEEYPWSTENPASIKGFNHPTVKSIQLMEWLIQITTEPNDIVLDPFCGSGTTLLAAKNTGRRAIGIEIKEEFCKLAKDRLTGVLSQ